MAAAPKIELVVTDLDGTVWETPSMTHPEVTAALHEVRQSYPLLVATGRRLRSTRESLAGLGLQPPVVVLNGALVVDLATNVRLHRHALTADVASKVLQAFTAVGLSPCVYVDDGSVEVFLGASPDTHPEHLKLLGEWSRSADLEAVVATMPVYAFALIGQPAEPLRMVADALEGVASCYVEPDRMFGGVTINVHRRESSKWSAVEAYCRQVGLDPAAVLALGDGCNDIELLANAAVALVPEDGDPRALGHADQVIGRAADGGWVAVLDHLASV